MAVKEWIQDAGRRVREAIEQALPVPQRPELVPVRIPVPVYPPRTQRRYY